MNLHGLRYLVALYDTRHFGRAANACHVSQPTLSTQIRKLEAQLGVALFERTNRSVRVTPIGEEVVARARQILTEVETIVAIGRRVSAPLVGVFSLGVIPTLGPYLLPWFVPVLKRRYVDLRLSIHESLTDVLLDRLASHRLDAALVALPLSDDDRVETLPLFDEPFFFAEPKGRGPTRTTVVTQAELRGQRLLLLTEGHCLRDQALAICNATGSDDDGDFSATSLETIRQMVATGMGCTLLPAMACGERPVRGVKMRPLENGVGRRIGLVWRRSYPRVRDLHLLAQTLRDHLPRGVTECPPAPVASS